VLGWLARLSFLADLLSRPVLVGPLTGIAVVMIVSQLTKITGVPVDGETLPVVSVSCRSGPNPSAVTGCLGTRCGRTRHWMRNR
jgi:MFS superfamily sulfate permease-like transporter